MKTTLPLATLFPDTLPSLPLPNRVREQSIQLPEVKWGNFGSKLLQPGPAWADANVFSLNLAQGCVHRCCFCSARAYPSRANRETVVFSRNLPERLEKELSSLRQRPRAVLLSPSTDPFMPVREGQALTVQVVQVLAGQGVEAWLMTRGYIRPFALEQLAKVRHRVRVTVGITTLNRDLQRLLEPLAAPPRFRLRNLAQLRQLGIPCHVEVAPLLPGITDTRANLTELLEGLAGVGVRHITAGYVFLRSRIEANLRPMLENRGWHDQMFAEFEDGPILTSDGISPARYLPKKRRQQGFAALMALAAHHGIGVSICSLTNPDFRRGPLPVYGLAR